MDNTIKLWDYVDSKKVQYQELKNNFKLVREFEKNPGASEDECLNCGDTLNQRWIPSESWTSLQSCSKCRSLNLIIRPDCMGGYCMDNVEVYQEK